MRTPARRRVPPPSIEPDFEETFQRAMPLPILMPIGKFRGIAVADIPDTAYICWLIRAQIIRSPKIAAEVERVHDERCGERHAPEDGDEAPWRS